MSTLSTAPSVTAQTDVPNTPETRRNYFLEVQRRFKPAVIVGVVGLILLMTDSGLGRLLGAAVVGLAGYLIYRQITRTLPSITEQQYQALVKEAGAVAAQKAHDEGLIDESAPGAQVLAGRSPAQGRHGLHKNGQFSAYTFTFVLAHQHGVRQYVIQWDLIDNGWTQPSSADWLWTSVSSLSVDGDVITFETFGGGRQQLALHGDVELAQFDAAPDTLAGVNAWRSGLPTFYNAMRQLRAEAAV